MTPSSSWLRIAEVAARVQPARVYRLIRDGRFVLGYRYVEPAGLGPRFHSERFEEWMRGDQPIAPAQRARGPRSKVNLGAVA